MLENYYQKMHTERVIGLPRAFVLVILTGILLWQPGCSKKCDSAVVVPVKFEISNLQEVAFIELNLFRMDGRPERADILRPEYFENGLFDFSYIIQDLPFSERSIVVVRRVFAHDRSWKQYTDTIPISVVR